MKIDDPVTEQVIAACIEVHRWLGPGLIESVYEVCLCHELALRGVPFARQVVVPVAYKDLDVGMKHRLDLLVDDRVVVELKAVEDVLPLHVSQLITYLKIAALDVGLLVNFNVPLLKHGVRRVTRRLPPKNLPLSSHPPFSCESGF
jgi:GxxExxY protein